MMSQVKANHHRERSKDMTNKMIDNRVMKLRKLEEQQRTLEQEAEQIRAELKAELEALEVEGLATEHYTIRWREIISARLDSNKVKLELPDIYERFTKNSTSKRFTIA